MKIIKRKMTGRREFLRNSSSVALGAPLLFPYFNRRSNPVKSGMICQNIADHFKKEGNWVNWKIGIRDTWQRELQIGNKIVRDKYPFYVTEGSPLTVQELSSHILKGSAR